MNVIKTIDFEPIIYRLMNEKKWTRRIAEHAVAMYQNYLYLKKIYGSEFTLPPSQQIDEVWHAHILHTEKYAADCKAIFGRFLHHNPAMEGENLERFELDFQTLQALHVKEFGYEIYDLHYSLYDIYLFLKSKIVN